MSFYQKNFIAIISKQLPEGVKLVDFISNLVHLGKEASYRRIRCEVEFTLTEVVTIAKELNINLTSLIIREGGEKVTCNLRLMHATAPEQAYRKKIEADLNILEGFDSKDKHTFTLVAHTIPLLFLLDSPLLTQLRLLKIQFNQGAAQQKTLSELKVANDTLKLQQMYWQALQTFDIEIILGPNILTELLCDISFFQRINLITDCETNLLKKEIESIIATIGQSTSTGLLKSKDIKFYTSHLFLDSSHSYISSERIEASVLDLHFPHSLLSFDEAFSTTQRHRIEVIKRAATLISQSGEIEKTAFLKKQYFQLENFI